ncbi:hypothetical protein HF866_07270 [Lactobacillus ruminis]|nr:hypothetical protein [Ligilactobacillus ruminis]
MIKILRGNFIVIDGLDGSGKTSLVDNLEKVRQFYKTFEPGGIEFGQK